MCFFSVMDFKNLPLTVAGWGKTRQGALTSSRYLLETKVQIVDGDKCKKSAIYRDNLVGDTMMCAYSLGKDACQVRILCFHEQINQNESVCRVTKLRSTLEKLYRS